jgi:hypothetical protein
MTIRYDNAIQLPVNGTAGGVGTVGTLTTVGSTVTG